MKLGNKGSSLLLAVFVTTIMSIIIMSLLGLLHRQTLVCATQDGRVKAFYVAEAGLRRVQWDAIAAGYTWPYSGNTNTSGEQLAPGAQYSVTATKTTGLPGETVFTVKSTGQAGDIKCTLQSTMTVKTVEGITRLVVDKWEEVEN